VPAEAKQAIEVWIAGAPLAEMRALIERLATCSDMREVWEKVPPDRAGLVITLSILAHAAAMDVPRPRVPPPPRRQSRAAKDDLASCARRLADDLAKSNIFAERWQQLWPSQAPISVEQYIELLRRTADQYDKLEQETWDFLRSLQLPRISRKRVQGNAPAIHFARVMSRWLQGICGQPLDAVVAALVRATFPPGPDEAITAETVRNWRRNQHR
jgi:hypothetical protein